MSEATSNQQSTNVSGELQLLQRPGLGSSKEPSRGAVELQEADGIHGSYHLPTSQETGISSQETGISSSRSSPDLSFASLHISAEDWETIDRETAIASCTALGHVPPTECHDEDSAHGISTHSVTTPAGLPEQEQAFGHVTDRCTSSAKGTAEAGIREQKRNKFKFSPSVLAHHANTACEKMLRLKGEQLWQQSLNPGIPSSSHQRNKDPFMLAEATMARGIEFESRLQETIQNRIDCEAELDKDSFFRFATSQEGSTLCQPIFTLDKTFYTTEMKRAGIVFGRFIPDFIRIVPGTLQSDRSRKKRLFIIDAKSSSHIKISHQFQVTLYAIFLDHLIKVNKQQHLLEIDPRGGVWIPNQDEPKVFSLAFMRPIVENFIFRDLPAILIKPWKSVTWYLDDPCRQCEFLAGCTKDASEQKTLSVIPLLTKKSAIWVKSLFKPSSGCGSEIEDLEDLVRDRRSLSDRDQSSLAKLFYLDKDGISPLLTSYQQHVLKVLPVPTMDLPRSHQDRLFINILTDPIALLPFAYSLDMFKEQRSLPVRSAANTITFSPPGDPRPTDQHVRLALELIDTLYEWLVQISEIQPKPPVLSIFFYNQAMRTDLCILLLKAISSKPDGIWTTLARSRAVELLSNMYEDPSLLTLAETAGAHVKLPDLLQLTQG
ncbi:Tripartite DNA replication factor [Modicella reniformis]|uniref:Tripartite DNA replication factor n=1 Tax=Modicella reniformis TaxID=1440133 RepID=A0A9P6MBJ7_9FUNG|nr:Tripartite DNA replication factor [Modicella reniformis]